MSVVFLESSLDTMTLGWSVPGMPREVEIRVNEQETPTKVTISGGLVKKKNLKAGDKLAIRIAQPDGSWGPWSVFDHTGDAASAPAPTVHLERDAEDRANATAIVEFPPLPDCSKYELAMFPLDGYSRDWVKVSDALISTIVRKKNLRSQVAYSFRYRGLRAGGEWGPWSAASIPQMAPESNPVLSKALAPKLMRTDGSLIDASTLSGKVVALYFSAHWCPPCRGFTPRLVEFYRTMKAMGKPFEVVFVSADHDERSFTQYFNEMGWLAVPYNDQRREELQIEHNISGIPSLKILSSTTGRVVEADAIRYPLTPSTFDAWQARM